MMIRCLWGPREDDQMKTFPHKVVSHALELIPYKTCQNINSLQSFNRVLISVGLVGAATPTDFEAD